MSEERLLAAVDINLDPGGISRALVSPNGAICSNAIDPWHLLQLHHSAAMPSHMPCPATMAPPPMAPSAAMAQRPMAPHSMAPSAAMPTYMPCPQLHILPHFHISLLHLFAPLPIQQLEKSKTHDNEKALGKEHENGKKMSTENEELKKENKDLKRGKEEMNQKHVAKTALQKQCLHELLDHIHKFEAIASTKTSSIKKHSS